MTVELIVSGKVQGVGYRYFVLRAAKDLGVTGWVMNRNDGCVVLRATGDADMIAALKQQCLKGPRASVVNKIEEQVLTDELFGSFEIRRGMANT